MLASTVQFSNNDQPPITPGTTSRVHWGRHPEDPAPQTPNSVPGRIPSGDHAFHALASSTGSLRPVTSGRLINVPPMSNHSGSFARSWLCAP
jgi:hypothetical protein